MASKVQRHLSYAAQKSNTHNSASMTWVFWHEKLQASLKQSLHADDGGTSNAD